MAWDRRIPPMLPHLNIETRSALEISWPIWRLGLNRSWCLGLLSVYVGYQKNSIHLKVFAYYFIFGSGHGLIICLIKIGVAPWTNSSVLQKRRST